MTSENTNFYMLMCQAVRNCTAEEFEEFRTGDVTGVTVHPRIRRKVKAAIRRMHRQTSMGWQIAKRTVVACLVIVTILFGSAMCIQPVRAAFWNAIVTWYERYVDIAFVAEEENFPQTILERKIPEIPDGWTITVIKESKYSGIYCMEGPEGKSITYKQSVYSGMSNWFDNTDCDIQEILLHDETKAILITYHQEESFALTWLDEYEYSLRGEHITAEQLIALAESIQ